MDWTIDQSQALKTRIISSPWLEEMVAFKDGMLALLLASGLILAANGLWWLDRMCAGSPYYPRNWLYQYRIRYSPGSLEYRRYQQRGQRPGRIKVELEKDFDSDPDVGRSEPQIFCTSDLIEHRSRPINGNEKVLLQSDVVQIVGWPSHGGLIVLEDASHLDFAFLELPSPLCGMKTFDGPDQEDRFCERLLQLGAIWWENDERRELVQTKTRQAYHELPRMTPVCGNFRRYSPRSRRSYSHHEYEQVVIGISPPSRPHETTHLLVGWPSTGGVWVAEIVNHPMHGINEDGFERLKQLSMLRLARSMDERCEMLQEVFGAKYHSTIGNYEGRGCLKWWNERHKSPWLVTKPLLATELSTSSKSYS